MLLPPLLEQRLDHIRLTGPLQGLAADRHPTVRDDHDAVERQTDHHDRDAREVDVDPGEHEKHQVGGSEHERADDELVPSLALGEWNELEREPQRG